MLLYLLDALVPRKAMATMHTTAIRATRKAYSTRLAPRWSSASLALRYGQMNEKLIALRLLEVGADVAELAGGAAAEEGDGHDADHGDQGDEERVLHEA